MADNNRIKKIGSNVLDAATEEINDFAIDATRKAIHEVLGEIKDWIINRYHKKFKSNSITLCI